MPRAHTRLARRRATRERGRPDRREEADNALGLVIILGGWLRGLLVPARGMRL